MRFHLSLSSTLVLIISQHQHGPWKQGAKRVEIIGKDDKRQITAVLGGTTAEDFPPIQLVYQGTTSLCLPSFKFPQDWGMTFSANVLSNEETMKTYLHNIIFPCLRGKKDKLSLAQECILPCFFSTTSMVSALKSFSN